MKTTRLVILLVSAFALVSLNVNAMSHDQRRTAFRQRVAERKAALAAAHSLAHPLTDSLAIANPDPAIFTIPDETTDANPMNFPPLAGMRSVALMPGTWTFEFGSAPSGKAAWEIGGLPSADRFVAPNHRITINVSAPMNVFLIPR